MPSFRDPAGELRRFAQRHPPPYVLAISGGRDSMALLAAAKKIGIAFEVVTVNHGLRKEAAKEVALVQAYHPATVVKLSPGKRGSLAWARDARYAALRRIAGARPILTAHHRDDLVETLLLRLFRGASPDAWASFNQPGVLRPFLALPRRDLERFVKKHRVPFLDDPSNRDPAHPRTLVREQLIPLLYTLSPSGWEERLCRFAADVDSDSQYLQSLIPSGSDFTQLPAPLQRRAVWKWLLDCNAAVQRSHLDATQGLLTATSKARVRLPGGAEIGRRGKFLARLKKG